MHWEPEVLEAEARVGEWLDCRARITSKELAPLHSLKSNTLQNACYTRPRVVVGLEKSALMHIVRLMNSRLKGPKRMMTKVAMLKITRQLGCVCQDMEPPKSTTILWKISNILKPILCVKFTKAVVRHADIRDQNPSLGMICPGDPHQRNTNAPKFEVRSQEETECQERWTREAAWRLTKSILKLKEKHKTAFSLPSETWGPPAPSTLKPVERICWLWIYDAHDQQRRFEFRWIGNRHDIEKSYDSHNRQWWSADAWSDFSVCQRIGYILDNESPRGFASSFIARKALWWTRILIQVDQRSKTTSHSKRFSDTMQHGELRSDRGSWFVIEFFLQPSFFNINDTFKTGDWSSYIFLKLVHFTNHNCVKRQWDSRKGRSEWDRFSIQRTCWTERNGETRFVPKSWNGCKNSERSS